MKLEIVYTLLNMSVIPAWGLLILAPNWRWTDKLVQAAFIPLIFAIIYGYFLAWGIFFGGGASGAGMGTLAQVMNLFDSPVSTLAGWSHYLVFDLFVGMWIVRDAKRLGVSTLWRAPCLVFTLVFGPIGLGLYLLLRWGSGKGLSITH